MLEMFIGLSVCFLGIYFYGWVCGQSDEEKVRKRLRNETIRAMHERLQLDNEMLHAMKAMMREAGRHTSPHPHTVSRRKE